MCHRWKQQQKTSDWLFWVQALKLLDGKWGVIMCYILKVKTRPEKKLLFHIYFCLTSWNVVWCKLEKNTKKERFMFWPSKRTPRDYEGGYKIRFSDTKSHNLSFSWLFLRLFVPLNWTWLWLWLWLWLWFNFVKYIREVFAKNSL